MRFSGGDAQSLGIVLTPRHITDLFCELADLKPYDIILDPCCGTGGFLVSAMNNMISKTNDIMQKIILDKINFSDLNCSRLCLPLPLQIWY